MPLQAQISVKIPTRPLPPSCSPHFQSRPRVTLAPGKKPLDCTLVQFERLPTGTLGEQDTFIYIKKKTIIKTVVKRNWID